MIIDLLPAAVIAAVLIVVGHLAWSREQRFRRHEAARRLRRAERERQWRAMIRGDDAV